ncbi:MAG TPA: NAD(P)/FAD-dependent oxidoreductase [Cytophagales bacterium]|nr:NAD(P)/FAD-dependent oxidoreductase [Cytophagales bacterium]
MTDSKHFEVIIVGGSYAGLSAAMALGRSLRDVLILDSGNPCNKQTPHSHNFITQDGETPSSISNKAKAQVLSYPTVHFINNKALNARKTGQGFMVETETGEVFQGKKLLFTTGVADIMPEIPGFAECWGISILHCPYCHGYEVRNHKIGLLGNGDMGYEFAKFINNWSKDLVLFTNGKATLSNEQINKIKGHNILLVEDPIKSIEHNAGQMQNIVFTNNRKFSVSAMFARVGFKQHSDIPEKLGCEITEQGFIKVDDFNRTTVPGVYAAGDNTTMLRAVSQAAASGTKSGAIINKELIDEEF